MNPYLKQLIGWYRQACSSDTDAGNAVLLSSFMHFALLSIRKLSKETQRLDAYDALVDYIAEHS